MRRAVCMWALLWMSTHAFAAPLERVLGVSVNVVVNAASAQLEIVAPVRTYMAVYSSTLRAFHPLDIPFSVRRLDGAYHHYELTLAELNGQCAQSGSAATPLGVSAQLDEKPFDALSPGFGVADPEQAHLLRLTFPSVPQLSVAQTCEGVAAVIAAVKV